MCHSHAQNIIVNNSFEDTIQGNFGITRAKGWTSPTDGSPDLIDSLSRPEYHMPQNYGGYQFAQDSSRYFGLAIFSKNRINLREYIQSELNHKLIKDSAYCFQFFISLGDSSNYAVKNNLGIYFSAQSFNRQGTYVLNYIPQIEFVDTEHFVEKIAWVKCSAQYTATGDEKFITIGNFRDNADLDTLYIGGGGEQPYHDLAYYYIDNLYLGHCDSIPEDSAIGLREVNLKQQIIIYPNPVQEQLYIRYEGHQKLQIKLYNLVGQSMMVATDKVVTSSEVEMQLSFGHLPNGIYLLRVNAGEETASIKILKE